MFAAVFVAVGVMAMAGVVAHLDAKGRRIRLLNEIDSLELTLKQTLGSSDLCTGALRNGASAVNFNPSNNPPAPPGTEYEQPNITRIYLGTSNIILACRSGDNHDRCPDNLAGPQARGELKGLIRRMRFVMQNNTATNRVVNYRGRKDGRYRLYSGRLEVTFEDNLGGIDRLFGGQLKPRDFGLHLLVNTNSNAVETCYSTISPAQICAQMSGRFNPATGACFNILGTCEEGGANPPYDLAPCPSDPLGCRGPAGELSWRKVYVAQGFDSNMQLRCTCTKICVPTTDPTY
jgi:hypothetical protein